MRIYIKLLTLFFSGFLITACAVNIDTISPKLQRDDGYKTARMKYTWQTENGSLKINIKNTSFELLLKSELYVRFYKNKKPIKGFNKFTFPMDTGESETLIFGIPQGAKTALVHYNEYDPRKGSGLSNDFDGEFDYHDFGNFLIKLH